MFSVSSALGLAGSTLSGRSLQSGEVARSRSFSTRAERVAHVLGVGVVADEVAAGAHGRDGRGTGTHERIEHEVALVRVQIDEPQRQFDRERRGMVDAPRALGRHLPHVRGAVHELLARERRQERQVVFLALRGRQCAVEPTLARDHDPFGEVAQHRVGRLLERTPRARTRRTARLLPDHFAAQQQLEVALEDGDDVGGQRSVRAPTEVGDVHRDAAARFELLDTLGEHRAQHVEVLQVGGRYLAVSERFLVLLAREVRRRGDDEGDRRVGDLVHARRALSRRSRRCRAAPD